MGKFVTDEMIDNITAYHVPKNEETKQAHEEIRARMNELMKFFNSILPDCPTKTHLINVKCREVMMHANAVIACEGGPTGDWISIPPKE